MKILKELKNSVIAEIKIKDLPKSEQPVGKDKNQADIYAVPEGVEILTIDPKRGLVFEQATGFTVEENCEVKKVVTTSNKSVTVSSNESIAVYTAGGKLLKVKPEANKDYCVPVVKQMPYGGAEVINTPELDRLYGWFIGAFVSDGWVSRKDDNSYILGMTKSSQEFRDKAKEAILKLTDLENGPQLFHDYKAVHMKESNCGIGGESIKFHFIPKTQDGLEFVQYLYKECYTDHELKDGERSCLKKKLPSNLMSFNENILLGILEGLLDGDGSVAVNTSLKKPRVMVNFATSSQKLRDDVSLLFRLLGLKFSITEVQPKPNRVQKCVSYTLSPSVADLAKYKNKLQLCENKSEILKMLSDDMSNPNDTVPVDLDFLNTLKLEDVLKQGISKYSFLYTYKKDAERRGFTLIQRKIALKLLDAFTGDKSDEVYATANAVITNETIYWERIAKVEDCPSETVYDVMVPNTKVFMANDGIVVFDTVNVHVPGTDDAVKDIKEKLMPSKQIFSIRDSQNIVNKIKQDQLLGLAAAAKRPSTARFTFRTKAQALAAIKSGRVKLNDDVVWLSE